MSRDIKALVKEVLEKGYLMSLATNDAGGVWVADVIYIHDDDLNIYWMSDPEVRHSTAIAADNKVAGTITVNGPKEANLGLQFSATAERIDGPRHDLAEKHFRKRGKPAPKADDDVLEGDSWYVLRPGKLELIYESLFGFKKQQVTL
jgi:uncharacterized protein YhbP (UPF0306 family)